MQSPTGQQIPSPNNSTQAQIVHVKWSPNGVTELSEQTSNSISELSPTPERSPINIPKRAVPASMAESANAQDPSAAETPVTPLMQPSLSHSTRSAANREGADANDRSHVLSFMEYEGTNPGPAR